MISDVPVGAFLSGGLDSSAIVNFAKNDSQTPLQCFTIKADQHDQIEGFVEDLPYAKSVAKYLGVPLNVIEINSNIIQDLEKMIYHLDQPHGDLAPINTYYVSNAAQKMGIKVLLSGTGGDDLFSGYRRHFAVQYENVIRLLPHFVLKSISSLIPYLPISPATARRLIKLFQHSNLPIEKRIISYLLWLEESSIYNLYNPSISHQIERSLLSGIFADTLKQIPAAEANLNKLLMLDQKHFLTDHNLIYTDKMGMAASVEIRVPLIDLELVEFATSLPPKLKQKGKISKCLFKKAMEPYLPKNIIYRPKAGFGAPIRKWILCDFKPLIQDLLSETRIKKRGIFDPQKIATLIQNNTDKKIDASYSIFNLLCLEIWCNLFLDK
jgi:asparagine synthase (glutamine-hydrolysing)